MNITLVFAIDRDFTLVAQYVTPYIFDIDEETGLDTTSNLLFYKNVRCACVTTKEPLWFLRYRTEAGWYTYARIRPRYVPNTPSLRVWETIKRNSFAWVIDHFISPIAR